MPEGGLDRVLLADLVGDLGAGAGQDDVVVGAAVSGAGVAWIVSVRTASAVPLWSHDRYFSVVGAVIAILRV